MNQSRSRILFAGLAGAAMLGVGAVGILALTSDDSSGSTSDALELHVADPLLYDHTALDRVSCPDGRGSSPIADTDHDRGASAADTGFAEGQVVVLTVAVTGPSEAVGEPVGWTATTSDALSGGIACAFVDESDPELLESPGGTEATASVDGDRLELVGLEDAETVVIELWSVLVADDRNDAAVSLTLVPELAAPGAEPLVGGGSLLFSTDIARSNRGDGDPTIEVTSPDPNVRLQAQLTSTVTVGNPSDVEPVSRATLSGTVGINATIDEIVVTDEIGSLTVCTTTEGSYECVVGFLAPEEIVAVTITATATDTELPEGEIVTPGSVCTNRQPRVCHRAELTYLDSLDTSSVDSETQVPIITGDTFTVFLEADEPGHRTGDPVDFEIRVSLNLPESTADSVSITTDVCDQPATLSRGDLDDDRTMDPGEVWTFICSTESLARATALVSVIAEIDDQGDSIEEQYPLEFEAYDARMELTLVPVVDGTSWNLTNTGTSPLTQVQLLPIAETVCEPQLVQNGNGDEILDADEVWEWFCEDAGAVATATAFDQFDSVLDDQVDRPANTTG